MASQYSLACSSVDKTFGPHATGQCRGGFDFTLLFEETILSILPVTITLVVAPFRLFYLFGKQQKVAERRGLLLHAKLVCPLSYKQHSANTTDCSFNANNSPMTAILLAIHTHSTRARGSLGNYRHI